MWYPLANIPHGAGPGGSTISPSIDAGPFEFVPVLEDIQSLNKQSERGDLEVTVVSIHQYPYMAE